MIRVVLGSTCLGWPEGSVVLRFYIHPARTPKEIEKEFRKLLISASHYRAVGEQAGQDWIVANLDFLNATASALGCGIFKTETPKEETRPSDSR